MIAKDDVKVGDKVYYQPSHYPEDKWENGIVKEIPEDVNSSIRVVYNCNEEWDRYYNYTSHLTSLSSLHLGWKH